MSNAAAPLAGRPNPISPITGLRRLLGGYYITAAVLMLIWMALPHPAGVNDLGIGLAAGGMLLVSAFLLSRPNNELGPRALNTALLTVTILTSLVYYFSGRPGGTFVLLYVWSVPFAFALVSFRSAIMQTAFAATSLIIVVNFRPILFRGQVISACVVGVVSLVAVSALVDQLMRFLAAGRADRERLDLQLAQSQRLESLGHLAGGVAHDFNNLLAVMLNYADFAGQDLDENSVAYSDLEQVKLAAERGARLTHQLLAFARQEVVRSEVLSLNDVVDQLDDLLRRSLGEQVTLRFELADELSLVLADRGQLEQVLVNLAVNARDAMPRGGTLAIDTADVEVDVEYAASRPPLRPGRWVRLRVSDNGTGMHPDTLRQAFDPFFTTKAKGQGTGLGLATIHGIVSQVGGYCQLYSEPGQGTTFSALFPATSEAPEPAPTPVKARRGGGETVLVVEDEGPIREVTRRVLSAHGYRVLLAEDGLTALAILESGQATVDLVLSDLVMPQLSGRELAERIKSKRPETRFMFMSGYASNIVDTRDESIHLLEKPFSGQQLLVAVRDALDVANARVETV